MLLRSKKEFSFFKSYVLSKRFLGAVSFCILNASVFGQMSATFTTTPNTNCNGSGCNYSGPTILINEMMMSPTTFDGSLWEPNCVANARCGEWIELYNPNLCEPIDVSCYYLGNYAVDGLSGFPGGYTIPPGTIIPPSGFLLLRGQNSTSIDPALLVQNGGNTVEIVVSSPYTCIGGGNRLWFPNSGSWFAFYDNNGVPQDAVSWGSSPGSLGNTPCIATVATCSFNGSLPNYNSIPNNRKNNVYTTGSLPNSWGQSIRRFPDGAAWQTNQGSTTLTPGSCNTTCIPPSASSCTGTATVTVTGGTAPYSYDWNDSQGQLTQTAIGLCAGTYNVIVTDNLGVQATFTVDVLDFEPPVTINVPTDTCIDVSPFPITDFSPIPTASQTGTISGTGVTSATFSPAAAGAGDHTISYVFVDENGCTNSATDVITVNPLPIVAITGIANPYCISNTPIQLTLTPAGGTLSGPGVSNNEFIPAVAGAGTHTLTYSYTDPNGCSATTTATVTVVTVPAPTFTIPPLICNYESPIPLTGNPAGGVFTVNGTQTTTFDPVAAGDGTHSIVYTYTDANNCVSSATNSIDVLPRPVLSSNLASVYCFETANVTLTMTPAGGTLSGDNVSGNSLTISTALPGNYNVTYVYADANGCENTLNGTYTITIPVFPKFDFTGDCFQNANFVNQTTPAGTYQYNWSFPTGETSTLMNPSTNFPVFGNNSVTLGVTDGFGCLYDTTQIIQIAEGISMNDFVIPNVITADGDGINDELVLNTLLEECIDYKILILNRWGNVVYEMDGPLNPFAGFDKGGKQLQAGVYFYIIESDDFDCSSPEYKGFCSGFITVVR